MKEILTLSLGQSGNFSSCFFWQIQDMYDSSFAYHPCLFVQTPQGYFPRMLGLDRKESLSLPLLDQSESSIPWSGKIDSIPQLQSTEEKWTDLLTGMFSSRNLVPLYQNHPATELIEEKIRYFSEVSDKLQGIHTFQSADFYSYTLDCLGILDDYYPKIPNLLISMDLKFTAEEEIRNFEASDYSHLLHLPCTNVRGKQGYGKVAVFVDVVSYFYRTGEDMAQNLQQLLRFPRGNTANALLNEESFTDNGVVFYEKTFFRNESNLIVPLPIEFPLGRQDCFMAKLSLSTGISTFFRRYTDLGDFRVNQDDLREAKNYTQTQIDCYSSLDFFDDDL
jgi:hypothetical protein